MTRQRLGIAAVVVAAALVGWVLWRGRADGITSAPGAPAVAAGTRPSMPVASGPGSAAPVAARTSGRLDPGARDRLVREIAAARARRSGATASGGTASAAGGAAPALTAGALDTDYVRTQIRELIPLLTECYEQALEDDPVVAGKLVVEFTIGGEPELGGLVETSAVIAGASTITHAGMIECVRETMYAAEFVAPGAGGQVTVRYPFAFQPGDDGG